MGADIIIAIDAQSELATSDKLQAVPDVVNQLMLMICQSELDIDKIKQVDSYIKVNVKGYNAASFQMKRLTPLIIRGENAARANYISLLSIKDKVGIVPSKKPHNTSFQLPFSPQYTPIKNNQLRAALRFDSENIAAILLNLNLQNLKTGKAEIALRGGRQSFLNTQYS
ncbi:MAG: patatin, partial [Bacteroides sp.]